MVVIDDKIWQKVIEDVQRKAHRHLRVYQVTVASAAIVLVGGVILAFLWIRDPLRNIGNVDIGSIAIVSGVRAFALVIVGYLVGLLTTMYRYNAQLWNHFTTRAWALELAASSEITLESAVAALSSSTVKFTQDGPSLADIAASVESKSLKESSS